MLARGGHSQDEVAAAAGCSKRDASRCARHLRETGLTEAQIEAMGEAEIAKAFVGKPRQPDQGHLQIDAGSIIARKARNPRLPLKLMWAEHCEAAAAAGKLPYSYSQFCEILSREAQRSGAAVHLIHEPGQKAFIDWAGDTACITDRVTGVRTKAFVPIICLPRPGWIWARGCTDCSMRSWLDGHMRAFEALGGVPHMLVPDSCAPPPLGRAGVAKLNDTCRRFAERYGCGILPARIRKPKDKSLAEGTVSIVEQRAIAPSHEPSSRDLDELNEYLDGRVAWLNARQMPDHGQSRDERLQEELPHLLQLPPERYGLCEWRRAKVAPDCHIRADCMHHSVPFGLAGQTVDVGVTDSEVRVMHGGEAVAEHRRLRGRKGQHSTGVPHLPQSCRDAKSPWPRERFGSWADAVGGIDGRLHPQDPRLQANRRAVLRPVPQRPRPGEEVFAGDAREGMRAMAGCPRHPQLHSAEGHDPRDQGRGCGGRGGCAEGDARRPRRQGAHGRQAPRCGRMEEGCPGCSLRRISRSPPHSGRGRWGSGSARSARTGPMTHGPSRRR